MTHGDPSNPAKNPHPVKRYVVTATSYAPGPWDAVEGVAFFDVINKKCVPMDSFTGGQSPPNTSVHFEMTRMNEKTWKGYFYRDALVDEDYFGLGVCHWDVTSLAPVFTVHSEKFGASTWFEDALHKGAQTTYFKKSEFLDHSLGGDDSLESTASTPEVIQRPSEFFPITVTVKEATP